MFTGLAHRQSVNLYMKNWVQNSTSSPAMFIHHFGKIGRNDDRPIVAKFLYHQQLKIVLGMSINYGVAPLVFMNNFPTKQLKDVISRNEETRKRTTMVHDRQYIEGELYTSTDNVCLVRQARGCYGPIRNTPEPTSIGKKKSNMINKLVGDQCSLQAKYIQ